LAWNAKRKVQSHAVFASLDVKLLLEHHSTPMQTHAQGGQGQTSLP